MQRDVSYNRFFKNKDEAKKTLDLNLGQSYGSQGVYWGGCGEDPKTRCNGFYMPIGQGSQYSGTMGSYIVDNCGDKECCPSGKQRIMCIPDRLVDTYDVREKDIERQEEYGGPAEYKWFGTAPFCSPQCQGLQYGRIVQESKCGDGKCCATGMKYQVRLTKPGTKDDEARKAELAECIRQGGATEWFGGLINDVKSVGQKIFQISDVLKIPLPKELEGIRDTGLDAYTGGAYSKAKGLVEGGKGIFDKVSQGDYSGAMGQGQELYGQFRK